MRTGWLHYGLLTAIALMIVASLKAVGIILSIALLVAPGAIAFLVARTFAGMLTIAVGSVVLSALIGIFASYHIDSEPAPYHGADDDRVLCRGTGCGAGAGHADAAGRELTSGSSAEFKVP